MVDGVRRQPFLQFYNSGFKLVSARIAAAERKLIVVTFFTRWEPTEPITGGAKAIDGGKDNEGFGCLYVVRLSIVAEFFIGNGTDIRYHIIIYERYLRKPTGSPQRNFFVVRWRTRASAVLRHHLISCCWSNITSWYRRVLPVVSVSSLCM